MQKREAIRGVPVNVITGFLGVGKTTAIRHLLNKKPSGERWAVLVNEFGEVGVDGGLFGSSRDGELFIREVPGGCMCCSAGLPMQVALNQLLARARPHRLLIEPTGLGHPQEVLGTLAGQVASGVLDLRATLALVDARCIEDDRYLKSDTFRQQLEVADLVVANKVDLYGERELENLRRFLGFLGKDAEESLLTVEQGRIQLEWLHGPSNFQVEENYPHIHQSLPSVEDETLPECGYLRKENRGGGYYSCGWRFDPMMVFDYDQLFALISGADAERVKGVFITGQGVFGFNKSGDVLSVMDLDDAIDSRVEVIVQEPRNWCALESALLNALSAD